jgi:hypothetical protein
MEAGIVNVLWTIGDLYDAVMGVNRLAILSRLRAASFMRFWYTGTVSKRKRILNWRAYRIARWQIRRWWRGPGHITVMVISILVALWLEGRLP